MPKASAQTITSEIVSVTFCVDGSMQGLHTES
jgi:hypothetical protein